MIKIRAFRETDYEWGQELLEAVQMYHAKLRPDIYKNVVHFSARAYYSAFLHMPEELSAVAETDGVMAGICLASLEERGSDHLLLTPRRFGSIEVLSVAPVFRRQGVAEVLMDYVKQRAQALGLDGLDLNVTDFNLPAKTLYEKLGFSPRSCKMEWNIEKETKNDDLRRIESPWADRSGD